MRDDQRNLLWAVKVKVEAQRDENNGGQTAKVFFFLYTLNTSGQRRPFVL